MTDVKITPVLKGNTLNPSVSANYRPIAISNSASKLMEKIIFSRLANFLATSGRQFGFKKNHSTDMCILALKETIDYYRSLNTPVFACFMDIKSAFDRVSRGKLFQKLISRGAPYYIVAILKTWYDLQRLFVVWGHYVSSSFGMSNGIRQGSLISPHLFNVYIDDLNHIISNSKLGCHIGTSSCNSFAYADDLVILAPSATGLNELLNICNKFAVDNLIEFSTRKTVVLLIQPQKHQMLKPNIYLGSTVLSYVTEFKYLGHMVTVDFMDDSDIERELRSMSVRGNVMLRKFQYCDDETKCYLFRTFFYQMYTCPLWSRYRKSTLNKLRVCYNTVMRRLLGLPPWASASQMFATLCVRSFQETHRVLTYSLMKRVDVSLNSVMSVLRSSDASLVSTIRKNWRKILYVNN